jgi:crotonobetaine/carnitine-CoA ligase
MDWIRDLLERRARDDRARPFCLHRDGVVTYGALGEAVTRLAGGLARLGVSAGDRVAVVLPTHLDHIYTFLALARLEAIQVPINVHLKALGLRFPLEHSEARVVVADARCGPELGPMLGERGAAEIVVWHGGMPAGSPARAVRFEDVLSAGGAAPRPVATASPQLVSITYTSGTTGAPKGVMMTEAMYRAAAETAGLLADLGPGDVLLFWEPVYHIGGSETILASLLAGVPIALVERFSASRFWADARRYGATHIHHLGGIMGLLMKQPARDDDAVNPVRISWGGGAPAPIWEAFERRFGLRIREAYGLTEGASFTTVNLAGRVGSVGTPVAHFEVRIVGDDGAPCGPGQVGEIIQRGREPGLLTPGYFKDPERTAATLRDGWLYTGDLAYADSDGFLYLVGRKKDSLRRRGENVSAWEVERVVNLHPEVEESAVIGVPSDLFGGGDEEIKIFVRRMPGADLDPLALIHWCERHLAHFQIPRYIQFVESLPKTPSERIKKDALSRSVADSWDLEASGYRPRRGGPPPGDPG